ncbi:MAG: preprotein translocase subunit SecD [Clostridia bacterium]|nr:preprotein translocase subunit SecD [Clostridia bacterium]
MKKSLAIVVLTVFCVLIVLGAVFAFVSLDDGQLGIYDYVAFPNTISLGLDLKGGVYAVFEARSDDEENLESRMQGTADALEELLFEKGYTEAVVSLEGNNDRIRVEVPDVDDPETIFTLIGKPASLVFSPNTEAEGVPDASTTYLTGKDVENAYVSYDNASGYVVALEFNEAGTKKFAAATEERLNQTISIWINGVCKMSPTVNSVISNGRAIITGNYTFEEANALATSIQAGAFDVELTMVESNTITATLGANSVETSVLAGLIGLALIIVFVCVVYRLLGVAASLSLLFYALFYVFFLSIFPWVQLTLSGIAGIVLSLGMAVDGNVIVFSRIRDEFKNGNGVEYDEEGNPKAKKMSIHAAIKAGFRKATPAIIDGNITTVLGCIVMMFVGGSSIKSFAITLLIGVVVSVLCVLLVTRVLVYSIYRLGKDKPALYNLPVVQEEGGEDHE